MLFDKAFDRVEAVVAWRSNRFDFAFICPIPKRIDVYAQLPRCDSAFDVLYS